MCIGTDSDATGTLLDGLGGIFDLKKTTLGTEGGRVSVVLITKHGGQDGVHLAHAHFMERTMIESASDTCEGRPVRVDGSGEHDWGEGKREMIRKMI